MNWLEIRVHTSSEAVEAVSSILMELGAGGTVIDDPEVFTRSWDSPFGEIVELDREDYPEEGVVVRGYFPESTPEGMLAGRIRDRLAKLPDWGLDPGPAEVSCRIVSEETWESAWKKYYKPVRVTEKLTVSPVWESVHPARGETVILLDPGMAFGTGTHATTQMCLRLLEKHLHPGDRVIDVGCGSGILSIAAAKLGAGSVLAVDLDEVAVRKTRENAGLNGVQDQVFVRTGDLLTGVTEGGDLILANLLSPILLRLARDIRRVLRPGGRLIASGIVSDQVRSVQEALEDAGLETVETIGEGDWVALVAKR
ncbi:MAG: 50S ribosomal protein L11 methyltransferase [Planifilum fulgidum]